MTRFFDILFSLLAIIVLLPFMIPIMIGLKLTGEHDIFYKQMRVGKGGKEFGLLKFATMLRNSPNLPGGLFTSENDPRMLPMGKFLRKTKINELPQLINILKGDMSVIGYRPQTRSHYDYFPEEDKEILRKSTPGLSGIGSIAFRNEEEIMQEVKKETGSDEGREKFYGEVLSPYKSKLECWYVQHKNIGMYFKLIWLTVIAVLSPGSNSWKNLPDIPEVPDELKKYI